MNRILFTILLSLSFGSACTRVTDTKGHAGPATQSVGAGDQSPANMDAVVATDTQRRMMNAVSELSSEGSLTNAQALADELFQASVLRNPGRDRDPGLIAKVWALNQGIIRAAQSQSAAFRESNLADRYRQTVLQGCRGLNMRTCRNLELFQLDVGTAQVLRILALDSRSSAMESHQLLLIAQDLGNGVASPELSSTLFSSLLGKISESIETRERNDGSLQVSLRNQSREQLNYTRLLADNAAALLRSSPRLEISTATLDTLFQWTIRGDLNTIFGPTVAQPLTQVVLDRLQTPALWERFSALMRQSEESAGDEAREDQVFIPHSLTSAERRIRSTAPAMANALHVPDRAPLERYRDSKDLLALYALNRLFAYDSLDQIAQLLRNSSVDQARFLEIAESYLRGQFAALAGETNRGMSRLFTRVSDGTNPRNLLTRAMQDSRSEFSPLWKDYFKKVGRVRTYFIREIEPRQSDRTGTDIGRKSAEFRHFLDFLGTNAKYAVIYPNILMFAYYAKKIDYREQFDFPGVRGGVTIDAKLIMRELMGGVFPPIFNFLDDESDARPLNKIEVLYAVYFAVRGDLPRFYRVDFSEWFNQIAEAELESSGEKLRDNGRMISRFIDQNDPTTRRTNQICSAAEGTGPAFENSIPIESVMVTTVLGRTNEAAGSRPEIGEILRRFQASMNSGNDLPLAESIEQIRSDLNPSLRRLYLIRNLYRSSPSLDAEQMNRINQRLETVTSLRDFVVHNAGTQAQKMSECLVRLSKAEHLRRHQLYAQEESFWALVYTSLELMEKYGNESGTFSEVRARHANDPIWQNPALQAANQNLSIFDAVRELTENAQGLAAVDQKIPGYLDEYRRLGGIQRGAGGRAQFVFRKIDLIVRTSNQIERLPVNSGPDRPRINWPSNLRDLKRKIFSYFNEPDHLVASFPAQENYNGRDRESIFRSGVADWFFVQAYWFGDTSQMTHSYRRLYQSRLAYFKAKHALEVDPETLAACDEACVRQKNEAMRLDAQQEMRYAGQLLDEFNLDAYADDRRVLRSIGRSIVVSGPSDYVPSGPLYLFVNDQDALYSYLPLFDQAFNFVTAFHLGRYAGMRGYRPTADRVTTADERQAASSANGGTGVTFEEMLNRLNLFEDAHALNRTLRDQDKNLLFPVDSSDLAQINSIFTSWIKTEQRLANAFLTEAEPTLAALRPRPMQFDLRAQPFDHAYAISPYLRNRYLDDMQKFNVETFGVFLPEELRDNPSWIYRD